MDLQKHSIKDTGGRSRKKHEDPPKGMYEEVDDSGRGERVLFCSGSIIRAAQRYHIIVLSLNYVQLSSFMSKSNTVS